MEGEHKVYVNGGDNNAAIIAALLAGRRGDDCGYGRRDEGYGHGPLHNDHVTIVKGQGDIQAKVGEVDRTVMEAACNLKTDLLTGFASNKTDLLMGFSNADNARASQTQALMAGQTDLKTVIMEGDCSTKMTVTDVGRNIADRLASGFGGIGAAISNSDRINLENHARTREVVVEDGGKTRELINAIERDRLRDQNLDLRNERHTAGLRLEVNQIQNNNQLQVQAIRNDVGRVCDRFDVFQNSVIANKTVNIGSGTAATSNSSKQNNV